MDTSWTQVNTPVLFRENSWKEVASLNTGRGGACVVVVQK